MQQQFTEQDHNAYMERCLTLAKKGAGYVAPNPMVGAVLVHNGRILGEGWHQHYGEGHAEVNCLEAVSPADKHLISASTMYVSLEPCAHHGKTPPCADLIIKHQIPRVVIGCKDSFSKVAGKGIEKLQNAGIEVILDGPWQTNCLHLNRRFFTFHEKSRPYITLKWAESADHFIAPLTQTGSAERLKISGPITNKLVHKWRSEEAAILVGKNTALKDDPALTNRLYDGPSPIKMALDPRLELPYAARLFQGPEPTIIFNYSKNESILKPAGGPIHYVRLDSTLSIPLQIAQYCYQKSIQSILVEGGKMLSQSFIDQALIDEWRIITNLNLSIGQGLSAPKIHGGELRREIFLGKDKISYFAADYTKGFT